MREAVDLLTLCKDAHLEPEPRRCQLAFVLRLEARRVAEPRSVVVEVDAGLMAKEKRPLERGCGSLDRAEEAHGCDGERRRSVLLHLAEHALRQHGGLTGREPLHLERLERRAGRLAP